MHEGYTGFGFIDLDKRDGRWVPRSGAFAAGNPGESFRSHTMVPLLSAPSDRTSVMAAFVDIDAASQLDEA